MAHFKQRELFSLSSHPDEIINSTKPISLSEEGQLLICCRATIVLATLSCDLDVRSQHFLGNLPYSLSVHKIIDLFKLPKCVIAEGVLDTLNSLPKLSPFERQDLLTDTCLYPERLFSGGDLGGFRRAVISPLCNFSQDLFVAVVTFDHQVYILSGRSGEWCLDSEFTPILKRHTTSAIDTPVRIGKGCVMSMNQYKSLIHSMSCVDLAWSSLFEGRNPGNCQPCSSSLLLFCGMRNGDLHTWQMRISQDSESVETFTFVGVNKYVSEVTAVCWHSITPDNGYVSVGYMNGSVRILNVLFSSDLCFAISENFMHEPLDHLAVFDLAMTSIDSNLSLVVAIKQFSVEIIQVRDGVISFVQTIHLDCSLPLESISVRGKYGTASCHDGTLFHFKFSVEKGNVCVHHAPSKVTSYLPNFKEMLWSCKGVALSLNAALCFSIHRPMSDHCQQGTINSRFLERQKILMSCTPDFSNENLLVPISRPLASTAYSSRSDVTLKLLITIQNIFKQSQSLDMIEELLDKFVESERIENLQTTYAIYVFEYFKIQSTLQSRALKFSSEGKSKEIGMMTLGKHISNCCRLAKKFNMNVLNRLPFMHKWLKNSEESQPVLSQSEEEDDSALIQAAADENRCYLCEAKLVTFEDLLKIKCTNGHMTHLCCLTLSPIKSSKFRHCLSCYAAAMDISELEKMDVPFIKTVHLCTLCGGKLK